MKNGDITWCPRVAGGGILDFQEGLDLLQCSGSARMKGSSSDTVCCDFYSELYIPNRSALSLVSSQFISGSPADALHQLRETSSCHLCFLDDYPKWPCFVIFVENQLSETKNWRGSGWWFVTFFIFPYIGNNNTNRRPGICQKAILSFLFKTSHWCFCLGFHDPIHN